MKHKSMLNHDRGVMVAVMTNAERLFKRLAKINDRKLSFEADVRKDKYILLVRFGDQHYKVTVKPISAKRFDKA